MSTDVTTIDQKAANEFLIHTLFDYLDKKGYLQIIYSTEGGQLPGFSRKNAIKAPLLIVKSKAKQQIKKISNAIEFLTEYTAEVRKKYENLPFHEFFVKINVDEKITDGEKLALFFLLYQKEYQAHANTIQENMKLQLPPLTNILSLRLAEKLDSLHTVSKQHFVFQETNFLDNFDLDESVFYYDEKEGVSLNEKLKNSPLPPPETGYYLSVYKRFLNESEQWEEREKVSFLQLVIGDFTSLVEKQFLKTKKLEKELKEANKERLQLTETSNTQVKKISSLENNLRYFKAKVDDLKKEINLLSIRNEELKKEIIRLSDQNDRYQENLVKLQSNYGKLKKQYEEQNVQNKIEKVFLFQNEKLYFITKIKSNKLSVFFTEDQLIYLSNDVDLNEIIKAKDDDAIYFFNVDGISTRESFKLEQPLKTNQLTYRLVSGGIENIIRKMIYYLEGELRDEIKEKH